MGSFVWESCLSFIPDCMLVWEPSSLRIVCCRKACGPQSAAGFLCLELSMLSCENQVYTGVLGVKPHLRCVNFDQGEK